MDSFQNVTYRNWK